MIPKPEDIARKNDLCRTTFLFCKVVLTRGVADSPDREDVITAVREFDESKFTPDNDPHSEHDFGAVEVNGTQYFWKFDYYDETYTVFKYLNRVLTIMRADEY
jgi:hypothetical protein